MITRRDIDAIVEAVIDEGYRDYRTFGRNAGGKKDKMVLDILDSLLKRTEHALSARNKWHPKHKPVLDKIQSKVKSAEVEAKKFKHCPDNDKKKVANALRNEIRELMFGLRDFNKATRDAFSKAYFERFGNILHKIDDVAMRH